MDFFQQNLLLTMPLPNFLDDTLIQKGNLTMFLLYLKLIRFWNSIFDETALG